MSRYTATHVSDEVSMVGNALGWLYLADTLAKGEKLGSNRRWINGMAREAAAIAKAYPRHVVLVALELIC
jgi:alpha,alpha-trehalose phosphorylase (configuration-retaining)